MNETRHKVVIDRKVWLRGEGSDSSYLLRSSDEKMCCVGIAAQQLEGCDRQALLNKRAAIGPDGYRQDTCFVTRSDSPLLACGLGNLYIVNDSERLDELRREEDIADLFAQGGIDVEFVG